MLLPIAVTKKAISAASASIVLFLEYAPETLQAWLQARSTGQPPDAALEAAIESDDGVAIEQILGLTQRSPVTVNVAAPAALVSRALRKRIEYAEVGGHLRPVAWVDEEIPEDERLE